jgi:Tfp pilus assembly protein PilF
LAAFQAGDMPGAQTQFEAALSKDPQAYEAHYSLAVVRERLGSPTGAQSSYQKALDIVPDYSPAVMGYAQLMVRTDRADAAESYLSGLRAKVPGSAAVLTALAEVSSAQGKSSEAQELAKEALKKNPDYRPAMLLLARDHYRRRRLDLALYTLTAILDGYGEENPPRDKNNAEARLLRALIYKEQNNRRGAMEELTRVLELRPDIVEARLNLAAYMLEAGNATEAVPMLETALKYDANNVLVHLNLGDGYRLQGRPRDAIERLQFVLKKDSELAQAHYNLGLVYMFSNNIPGIGAIAALDKAIGEFERYKEMAPRSRPGAGDDVDELIKRARNKKAIAEAMAAPAPEPPPPAAPAKGKDAPPAEGDTGGATDDGFSDEEFDDFE